MGAVVSRRDLTDRDRGTEWPTWFWFVGPIVFVGAIVASVFYPWAWW